ncbi:MAG: hypothetical protein ACKOA8_15955 [Deltaproteobacteria bacterium]
MKPVFGTFVLITALLLSACGRDDQGQQPPPQNPPVVNNVPPDQGGYTEGGGYGGYCGILCRWRLRRQQRRQGCWYAD